jgi:DNA helicase HerA-like ATPase
MNEHEGIGVILSQSTTQGAVCQLFEEAECGGIREGMLLLVEASPNRRRILSRVAEIIPYNDFFTEGDPWSEARRKNMPLPHEVARRYEICKLELLVEFPDRARGEKDRKQVTIPPHPGDKVCRIDPTAHQKDIFGVAEGEPGIIWYGAQAGYEHKHSPVPLNVEHVPMHMAIFGVTGSGKSFDTGALIERLVDISVRSGSCLSFPLVVIDAHGDYLEYAEHEGISNPLGAVTKVTRYVFPDAHWTEKRKAPQQDVQKLGINLDLLPVRDLANLIIQFYGGAGSELQIYGLERVLKDLKEVPWQLQDLFASSRGEIRRKLDQLQQSKEIHPLARQAIERALDKFINELTDLKLLTSKSPLQDKDWIDKLTRHGSVAIIDFSADGAPGVDLPVKQLVITYLASVLFSTFAGYKTSGQNRYLLFMIEEAQNFCPDTSYPVGATLARDKLSAIATQGRKFGLGLCLISQRPSFLDKIVLSMCNTFFIHRISPADVSFVRTVTGGLPSTLANRLTQLSQREMIITGQMLTVPFPVVIKVQEQDRQVDHPAGRTEVIKYLRQAREE